MPENADEILMSILMSSSANPDGLTKADILESLSAHGQSDLYDLCEAVEKADESDPGTHDESQLSSDLDDLNLDEFLEG